MMDGKVLFIYFCSACVLVLQCPEGVKGEKGERGEPVSASSRQINGLLERFCLSRGIYLDPVSTLRFNRLSDLYFRVCLETGRHL